MQPLAAHWFDGRTSQARGVTVHLLPGPRGPSLLLKEAGSGADLLELDHRAVGWPERWSSGRAPRKVAVDLREHGSLEVADVGAWQAALAAAGERPRLAERMQTRWPVFLGVLLVAVAALFAFYRWGTPWAATQLTRQVPLEWETSLSDRVLQDLDARLLKPSKLPAARQEALRARFDALAAQIDPGLRRYPAYRPTVRLQFRDGMGANAFALPGGMVVMTDGMVEVAEKNKLPDDALVGVLAHEIGHVLHRHTTRMVVEQGVLNIGFGLAMGDVSTLVSFGGSLLTGLAYRRSHETESDCFALALMRKAGLPAQPMADLLLKIEDVPPEAAGNSWWSMLSSHPETPQRARELKAGHVQGCA
ncbi:M48 family metallopeptidase [Caenimonas sedimenti]|uniref:M48 family metallopeptidase n=1 Tax=Caenimonas sedimenti TaxID=2596921 RepID=A0A562ZVE0_9BURK|nr:M48 family metallopeptidase [Caenimonas sedimenti]TWO72144.1 M48 family metallopeptidase [Caenimonas sedimenti]